MLPPLRLVSVPCSCGRRCRTAVAADLESGRLVLTAPVPEHAGSWLLRVVRSVLLGGIPPIEVAGRLVAGGRA
jgi:hypothetical protein